MRFKNDSTWYVAVLLVSCLAAYLVFSRCGYGDVSNESYEIATALYSVCNRQDSSKLTSISDLLNSAEAEKTITPAEASMLRKILDQAAASNWAAATAESRKLMEDQVKYP